MMASWSKQKRLPEWRTYDWPEAEYQEIKENLLPWREKIAGLLEIELNDFGRSGGQTLIQLDHDAVYGFPIRAVRLSSGPVMGVI